MSERSRGLPACLVGLVALAAQAPALRRVLIWDDIYLFGGATDYYTNPARLGEALTHHLGVETPYWRPFATTSFLLESMVHGGVAEGFRATAALLFAAVAVAAFFLLDRLVQRRGVAVAAALAFALHPAHVETVTWISGRYDLLAGGLSLCALLACGDALAGGRVRALLVGTCAALAMLSKESALLLPALVPLWAAAVAAPAPGGATDAVRARRGGAIAALAGIGVALFARIEVFGGISAAGDAAALAGGPLSRLLLVGRAAATSLGLLVAPFLAVRPIHAGVRPVPAGDVLGWAGVLVLAAAAAATWIAWRRRPRTGLLTAALLVSWLPTSQIVPLGIAGGSDTADRFQFLPCFFGVALLADLVAADLRAGALSARRAGATALVLLLSFAAFRTWVVTRWNDEVRFWEWAVDRAPHASFPRMHLATALRNHGDLSEAESAARGCEEDQPSVLATILVDRGRLAEALEVLDRGVLRLPGDVPCRLLRADVRLALGDAQGAQAEYEAAAATEQADGLPRFSSVVPRALAGSAEALAAQGEAGQARDRALHAAELAGAGDAQAWETIARALFAAGDVDQGARAAKRAVAAGAAEAPLVAAEARALHAAGRHAEQTARLVRLAELRPRDANLRDDLGCALWDTGDRLGAERWLREAVALDPSHARARLHLGVLLLKTAREEEGRAELERVRAEAAARGDEELLEAVRAAEGPRGGGR